MLEVLISMDSSRLQPNHHLDHCPVKPRVDCNHWKCVCNRMSCVTFEGVEGRPGCRGNEVVI
ncbi:hypothetical protein M758_5G034400 [Ceratodon purpureus]|nr:hypothetical protein M758_5G034400 [Ceratodon purpureus]